ncbi:response regulator receiver protein [Sphingobium sp. SYK-6]|uniref:response regulator transcription factor n=1 Tax=Sphingobium sp. (strain NBRC 103272 / SYK-6) TaxID=627192 RepID=UPI00022766F3|nr:response regulator [Sphingobium sp. SYK-6]BAK65748.1 response regulator receiver protein [Sphingobium sp. SYK-6]
MTAHHPPLIAVIDDDASLRRAIVSLLRSEGYGAEGYSSAETFLDATETHPDCVISDIHMPGLSGLDLKAALDRRGLAVPVILITARTEPALIDRADACGAAGLLLKPFEADTLISCLDRTLVA